MNEFIKIYIDKRLVPTVPVNNYNRKKPQSEKRDRALPVPLNPAQTRPVTAKIPSHRDIMLYSSLSNAMDQEGKVLLNTLMRNGKMLSRDSNDGSSTLENLYRIMATPRAPVFDSKNIIKETLKTLTDPYRITQNFGDIPDSAEPAILEVENKRIAAKIRAEKLNGTFDPELATETGPLTYRDINFSQGHTCPAASIEFNLADRKPAEFTRYVEGLTSPQKSVKTRVRYADLSPDKLDAVNALTMQNTDFRPIDRESVEVTVRPDENAYIRADVQEDARVPDSRSMIDVLVQAAFMQLGSRATYNSLTDSRSKDTGGGKGLNQFEIAFVESIADSRSRKVPLVYMELDDEATKILKYNYDQETTRKHLLKSLDKGHNIIVGFLVNIDDRGNVITPDGHEILLTGYKYDKNGKLHFKYNDTDDGNYFAPSWMEADSFIPTIHHANVPESAIKEDLKQQEPGLHYLQQFWMMKGEKVSLPRQQ